MACEPMSYGRPNVSYDAVERLLIVVGAGNGELPGYEWMLIAVQSLRFDHKINVKRVVIEVDRVTGY